MKPVSQVGGPCLNILCSLGKILSLFFRGCADSPLVDFVKEVKHGKMQLAGVVTMGQFRGDARELSSDLVKVEIRYVAAGLSELGNRVILANPCFVFNCLEPKRAGADMRIHVGRLELHEESGKEHRKSYEIMRGEDEGEVCAAAKSTKQTACNVTVYVIGQG